MEYPQIQFQLERWTGREYVPHGAPHLTTNPHTAGDYAERARMLGLPSWRMVRTDKARPVKVTRWRPSVRHAYSRSVQQVQAAYLAWAESRGLKTVTVYRGIPRHSYLDTVIDANGTPLFTVREVDPADFLGPVYPDLELAEAA